jgi:hypothetical protein
MRNKQYLLIIELLIIVISLVVGIALLAGVSTSMVQNSIFLALGLVLLAHIFKGPKVHPFLKFYRYLIFILGWIFILLAIIIVPLVSLLEYFSDGFSVVSTLDWGLLTTWGLGCLYVGYCILLRSQWE